jgi:hypothetical protein
MKTIWMKLTGMTLLLAIIAAAIPVSWVLVAALMAPSVSAGITPDPSAPAVAQDWCAVPLHHGSHCFWAKGVAILAGYWGSGNAHKFRLTRVSGRFEGRHQYQFRLAGQAGKCLGSNPGIPLGLVTSCRHGAGTVFVFNGPSIVSRYWTVHNGGQGDPNWDITDSGYHSLIRFRPEGMTNASQFWSVCNRAVCGRTGGVPA